MWWKLFALFLPFAIAGIFAFATLKEDVRNLSAQVASKADASVTEANQAAIIRELTDIHDELIETRRMLAQFGRAR